jgi:hypothetical protein
MSNELSSCRRRAALFFAYLVCVAIASRADAMLSVLRPLPELARGADAIVVGSIAESHSKWVGGRIVSDVTVHVRDSVKGGASNAIVVRVAGGSIDGVGMRVVGMPAFRRGDQSVLFLKRAPFAADSSYRPWGGPQAKLDIERVEGRELVRWQSPETNGVEIVPLADFAARIAVSLRRGAP